MEQELIGLIVILMIYLFKNLKLMSTKKQILENVQNIERSKIVGNNTVACHLTTGEDIIILHNTIIISKKDGVYTLNSGGWRIPTTKDRICNHSPARVYQKNNLWYIGDYLFYDGIQIGEDGCILSKKILPEKAETKNIKMKAKIKKFCSLITKDNLPVPGNGDCWYCLMHDKEGKSMGELSNNNDHLLSHIKENYMHGSLIVNAMKESGYRDMQIPLFYHMKMDDTIRRSVKKYLTKRLLTFNEK